jgi:hypothetical protein
MGHNINKTNLHKTSLSTQTSKTNRERKTAEEKKEILSIEFLFGSSCGDPARSATRSRRSGKWLFLFNSSWTPVTDQ